MILECHNHEFVLLADHALTIDSTLILSDTHFGKSASFRARGIPVPEGETAKDIARIRDLLNRHEPSRLIVAGDLLHGRAGMSPGVIESLSYFFSEIPCDTHLVLGNHDHHAGRLPPEWPITVHPHFDLGGVRVVHDPEDAPGDRFCICGHLHPVIRIREGPKSALRVPCFWLRDKQLVLPSFGSFTGGMAVHPSAEDRVFVPVHDRVAEIPRSVL